MLRINVIHLCNYLSVFILFFCTLHDFVLTVDFCLCFYALCVNNFVVYYKCANTATTTTTNIFYYLHFSVCNYLFIFVYRQTAPLYLVSKAPPPSSYCPAHAVRIKRRRKKFAACGINLS